MRKLFVVLTIFAGLFIAGVSNSYAETVPGAMIGGSVSCYDNVQTLHYWVHVSNTNGTVTAYYNPGHVPLDSAGGSFPVHGPTEFVLYEDNLIGKTTLSSQSRVIVPDDYCPLPTTTTTVPSTTTTTKPPSTTTTVPATTTTTKPQVTTTTVFLSTTTQPPVATTKPAVVSPTTLGSPPAAQLQVASAAPTGQLAETGAPSATRNIAGVAVLLLLLGAVAVLTTRRKPHA